MIFIVHPPFGQFLSTPSARRATRARSCACRCDTISIHALREEGDPGLFRNRTARCYFYPRPPRGGRPPEPCKVVIYALIFLSTPSARRATVIAFSYAILQEFLSTPSARRATKLPPRKRSSQKNFYPRPPRGGRQSGHPALDAGVRISIHALREEGDPKMVGSRKRY